LRHEQFSVNPALMRKLHPVTASLLADIAAYRGRVGITRTAFGQRATKDGFFISRLGRGHIPSIPKIERVYRYLSRNGKAVSTPKTVVRIQK